MGKIMSGLGMGMIMGASLMGAYMHFMPKMKMNNRKMKMASPYTVSSNNVKTN